MASLPAHQQPQRRTNSNAWSNQAQPSTSPVRTRSEDSQTLFLNKPDSPEQQAASDPLPPSSTNPIDDAAVKKCWICFSDSTEDTPETSPWRSPCPCALVAHEECLLDWIADMESPTNTRRNNNHTGSHIQCPQCKNEIKLARPRNLVVEAVRSFEKWGADLVYPGAATVLFGTVYNASMAWGIHSIYAVFGADDGFRILRPLILNTVRRPIEFDNVSASALRTSIMALLADHVIHWRLYVGIPLITPMVILSRTTFIDSILPVLPILFFATQTPSATEPLDFGTWPPSAGLAFSILPYARSLYNAYYKRVWLPKEKQWLKEIQPRARSELNENDPGNPDVLPDNMDPDEEPLLEVRLDAGWEEDWDSDAEDEEGAIMPQEADEVADNRPYGAGDGPGILPQGPAPPDDALPEAIPLPGTPPRANANAAAPVQQAAGAAGAGAQEAAAGGGENRGERMRVSLTPLAEKFLGALIFPSLAGMSGELLKLLLPRAWTTAPALTSGRPGLGTRIVAKGLLQEKWGRSLVGGCLFVVLKDAVMLYVRWKMAQMHRKRKVLDYGGKRSGQV